MVSGKRLGAALITTHTTHPRQYPHLNYDRKTAADRWKLGGGKKRLGDYCQASYSHLTALYVTLKFDITAGLRYYYGHEEQVMLSVEQQVCCVPSGNCTAPKYWPSFSSTSDRRRF
ncbi:hypothetical protein niasHT_024796 [Heterodera trifolii]|uniref:Uncharacterized protein n=1 Tax=Heterodera trifolii TaxID=157864 RepID=A0ABD2KG17_9BILA